jgi:flavin reductase (DIM6/NTAB) family NADH-FMN oxidoreductase RutF
MSSGKVHRGVPTLQSVEAPLFRAIMGSFATGVTVVTAGDAEGVRAGLTASAVSSVSAEPPLLLTCISTSRFTLELIKHRRSFAINILDARHAHIASHFASAHPCKFDGIETVAGVLGNPILAERLGHAECELFNVVEAGDHSIVIGHLIGGSVIDTDPLLYFRGRLFPNVQLSLQ